ncbi:protein kinase [Cryptosporidium ryanae]|uniref:protein kinase n=1 Tax=Cryptosporidium ryanae TaxID=515981 RepID=UPI00351A1360|nr:protein kinase [Cryptosporidium ryanae]
MNKYYISNKIGQGGYGKCYLIETKKYVEKDEKLVAKVVNIGSMTQIEKDRAIQEIMILEVVDHTNVIKLVEFYKTENLLCIVMELGEYGNLDDEITTRKNYSELIKKKYFTEDEIMYIFIQIIFGVKYLHDNNIIHSDIKSNNVVLFSNGLIKLTDFGISSILTNKDATCIGNVENDHNIKGTFYYLAPEIYENMKSDKYSDYWSIGCLLMEMCSLEKVFRKYTIQELMILSIKNSKVFTDEIENHLKVNKVNDRYSNELIGIIKGLLNPDPKKRLTIEKILNNSYMKKYLKRFLETCTSRNLNQFKEIMDYCNINTKYINIKDSSKVLELNSLPFWLKKDIFFENEKNKFIIKQDLGEWFKNKEKKARNSIKRNSSINENKSEDGNLLSNSDCNNTCNEIIKYLNLKRENNSGSKELTREEILVQLETTIDFFAVQLSSLNSKKVTTERIIRHNLEHYIEKNANTRNMIRNSNFHRTKSSSNNLSSRSFTDLTFKKNLKSKYDKEREQLRELMRRGRQKIKIERDSNNE